MRAPSPALQFSLRPAGGHSLWAERVASLDGLELVHSYLDMTEAADAAAAAEPADQRWSTSAAAPNLNTDFRSILPKLVPALESALLGSYLAAANCTHNEDFSRLRCDPPAGGDASSDSDSDT